MVGTTGYPNYCAPRVTPKICNYYIYKLKIQYYTGCIKKSLQLKKSR